MKERADKFLTAKTNRQKLGDKFYHILPHFATFDVDLLPLAKFCTFSVDQSLPNFVTVWLIATICCCLQISLKMLQNCCFYEFLLL